MNRSTKITTAIIVVLTMIGTAGAVYAKKRHQDHEMHAEIAVSVISGKLGLDSTQEQALTVLKDELLKAKDAMKSQMESTKADVQSLISADEFDQAKALEMISMKTATIDQVAPEVIVAFGIFMDSLNAEQKAEILEHMVSHGHRRGKWRH